MFCISPTVAFEMLGDEAVLFDCQSGTYFGLNEVGTAIWRQLEGGQTEQAILDHIAAEYAIDRETCKQDVTELLQSLLDAGLVSRDVPRHD